MNFSAATVKNKYYKLLYDMNKIGDYIINFYKERIKTQPNTDIEENILEYILSEDEKFRDETDIEAFYEEAVRVPSPPICLPPTPRTITPPPSSVATFKINCVNHCSQVFHNKLELMEYIQKHVCVIDGYYTFTMKINNYTVITKLRGGIMSVVNYVYNYHTILVDIAPKTIVLHSETTRGEIIL